MTKDKDTQTVVGILPKGAWHSGREKIEYGAEVEVSNADAKILLARKQVTKPNSTKAKELFGGEED
ncbi:MAG: hypothetical protein ACPG5W_07130 [Flavobacteriales bacterium]